jgi:8-oxo-dGTP pyrophosphatase MutT (NUDIX family)
MEVPSHLNCVIPVERVDFTIERWAWPFAVEHRTDIEKYFAEQQRANSALWNGRVLLLRDLEVAGNTLRGCAFEADYASMLAGISWQVIGDEVRACFGAAALLAADGAFVLGVMAPHTRNAGQVYFPSGSFDMKDVIDARVDCLGNVRRELGEETGLTPDDVDFDDGWHVVFSGQHVPLMKIVRIKEPAQRVRERILDRLRMQTAPEFSDIRIVRGLSDLDTRIPAWLTIFLRYFWR